MTNRRSIQAPARAMAARGGLALLALAGCADLEPLDINICGNRVVEEAPEECDGQANCGLPGTPTACRYECDAEAGTGCPEGYGCGVDGICRRHSGKFEPLTGGSTATTSDLIVGDIHGDRCVEMVRSTQRGTVITAFDSRTLGRCAASEQTLRAQQAGSSPAAYHAPLLADLFGDTRLEVVVPGHGLLGEGLLVHVTGDGSALSPALYPSGRVQEPEARVLNVRLRGQDTPLLLLERAGGMGGAVAILSDPRENPVQLAPSLPAPLEEIAALQAADLDGAGMPEGERCDEVAIGRGGDTRVRLFRLCDAAGAFMFAPLQSPEVQLDGAALRVTNASLVFAQVNEDDAHLDLVMNAVTPAGAEQIHVAYGLGDGRFHSVPPGDPPPVVADQRTSELVLPVDEDPILLDLLDPDQIFVAADFDPARPGAELVPLPCPPSEIFGSPVCDPIPGPCEAVVTDIDADGRLDIVANEGQQPDLVLRRGSAGGGFHLEVIETECPPHHLAAGDFDGDGINDIAFFDQVATVNELPNEEMPMIGVTALTVAYGSAFAAPVLSEQRGRFAEARGLAAGRYIPGAGGAQLLAARAFGMHEGGFALVEVQGERVLHAPYFFPPDMQQGGGNLRSVTLRAIAAGPLGELINSGGRRALLAVHTEDVDPVTQEVQPGTARLWLVEGDERANMLRAQGGSTLAPPCEQCVLVPMRAGDRDVVLLLGAGEIIVYEAAEGALLERDRLVTAHTFRSRNGSNPPKYAPRPLVDDFDGDGLDDVIARADDGALVALWGRADGGFDEAVLATPNCDDAATCSGLSIAALNADADAAKEVVVVGPGEVALYEIVARELVTASTMVVEHTLPQVTDFTTVGAGDVDGDGVDDLVFFPISSFFGVLRGIPVVE